MSTAADMQDLLGGIRGMCLVAIVRQAEGTFSRASAERIAQEHVRAKVMRFANPLHDFTEVDVISVIDAMNDSIAGGEEEDYFDAENVNIQLSLLSGRPIPCYPFVEQSRVDTVALVRPYLDVSETLLHAAVRMRMQGAALLAETPFWSEAILFLERMWGSGFSSSAMACATVANVASDVLFYNRDIESRTSDFNVIERSRSVMAELGEVWTAIEKHSESSGSG